MLLSNYTYIYQIINKITNNQKDITTFNIRLIGSRMSAKTVQALKSIIEISFLNLTVQTNIWRNEPTGATETFDEFIGVMEDIYKINSDRTNTNATKRKVRIGNNTIRFNGYLSNRKRKTPKLGKARLGTNKDIQINIFEEATEFNSEKDIQLMLQASGGAEYQINIFLANPWVISNWYVSKCAKLLPFDEYALRQDGEQVASKKNTETKTMDITHITNHRINTYLSQAQHQLLYDSWDISEAFAKTVDLGLPGVSEGLIYAPYLDKVKSWRTYISSDEFKAGLDIGMSTGNNASATHLIIGRVNTTIKEVILDAEWRHSNQEQAFKTDTDQIEIIAKKLMEYAMQHRSKIQNSNTGIFKVSVDYAAWGWISLLKAELDTYKERLVRDLISVVPCVKFLIPTRIQVLSMLIAKGGFRVNKELVPKHWEELETALWDDTRQVKDMPTRLNENDHSLDALEYLIGSDLPRLTDYNHMKLDKRLNWTTQTSKSY